MKPSSFYSLSDARYPYLPQSPHAEPPKKCYDHSKVSLTFNALLQKGDQG